MVKQNTKKCNIYFKKEGMTSIIHSNGSIIAGTLLSLLNQEVFEDGKNSNNPEAKKIYIETNRKMKKPQQGELSQMENLTHGIIKSTYLEVGKIEEIPFEVGQFVDVTSNSKGKGYAGVMKRWNFKGGRASHGASLSHRSGGSTGCRQDPGKTGKGKKMAGRLGNTQTTQQNLKILDISEVTIKEGNEMINKKFLVVHGSVPGPKKQIIAVRIARKK